MRPYPIGGQRCCLIWLIWWVRVAWSARWAVRCEFIPILGVGLQRTAEIFHLSITQYTLTRCPNKNGETMIEAARLLLDAAKKRPNSSDRKCEYVMMRRHCTPWACIPTIVHTTNKFTAVKLVWCVDILLAFLAAVFGFPALWWQSPDCHQREW